VFGNRNESKEAVFGNRNESKGIAVRATAERLSRDLAGDPKHIYKHKI